MRTLLLATLVGCGGGPASTTWSGPTTPTDTDPTTSTTTTTTTTTTITTLPDGLNGTEPAENLPPPQFAEVTNRDGSPRTQADLVGHPTVLWFYPAAATGG